MLSERRNYFEVIRAKMLYEQQMALWRGSGRYTYSLDERDPKGKRNYDMFCKIVQWCRSMNIDTRYYITILVRETKYPLGPIKAPYLAFLSSAHGNKIFTQRWRVLRRSYIDKDALKAIIKNKQSENFDSYFINSFYSGFVILSGMAQKIAIDEMEQKFFILEIFLAFPETFSKYFVITHSAFDAISATSENELTDEQKGIKMACVEYVSPVIKRAFNDMGYAQKLLEAREKVMLREKIQADRFFKNVANYDRLWRLLS